MGKTIKYNLPVSDLQAFVVRAEQSFVVVMQIAVVGAVAFCHLFPTVFLNVLVDEDIYIFLFDIGPTKNMKNI